MKLIYLSSLALLSGLGGAQAQETPRQNFQRRCATGVVGNQEVLANGVTVDYLCNRKPGFATAFEVKLADSIEDCVGLCQDGCASALWQHTNTKCHLFAEASTAAVTSRGSVYLVPQRSSPETGTSNGDDCPGEKQACEDELASIEVELATCQGERDQLAAQLAECPTRNYCESGYKDGERVVIDGKKYIIYCEKFQNVGNNDVVVNGKSLDECIDLCNNDSRCVHVVARIGEPRTCHLRYLSPTVGTTPPTNAVYNSAHLVIEGEGEISNLDLCAGGANGYKDNQLVVRGGKTYKIHCQKFKNVGNNDVVVNGKNLDQCIDLCNNDSKCVYVVAKIGEPRTCHLRYLSPGVDTTPPTNLVYNTAILVN